MESLKSAVSIPSNPPISRTKCNYRIRKPDDAHQFSIRLVVNDESQATAVSSRHRDTPMQARVSKEEFILGIRLHFDDSGPNPQGIDIAASGNAIQQLGLVSLKTFPGLFDLVANRHLMKITQQSLILITWSDD